MTAGFTEDEIRRLRAETPGCAEVAHFNNAGSSLPPASVLETHLGYLRREALIGGYEAQEEAQHRLDGVYAATAQLVGGQGPDEVALFENATRAFDMALYAVPLEPGDVILTSTAEYHSMFVTYLHRARRGVRVEVVAPDATGQLDVGALRKRLDARVRLIAMTHMPRNSLENTCEKSRCCGGSFSTNPPRPLGPSSRRQSIARSSMMWNSRRRSFSWAFSVRKMSG